MHSPQDTSATTSSASEARRTQHGFTSALFITPPKLNESAAYGLYSNNTRVENSEISIAAFDATGKFS